MRGPGHAQLHPDRLSQSLEHRACAPYIGRVMIEVPTLTPAAAKRIAAIAAKQSRPAVLRLSVEGGGCSGFQYRFDLADDAEADDRVSETDSVRLLVDPVSLELVAGGVVDFVESLGGSAFRVENPNAVAGCGCGSSFGI